MIPGRDLGKPIFDLLTGYHRSPAKRDFDGDDRCRKPWLDTVQFINGYVIDICGPREALLGVANKITGTPQGMRIVTTAVVVEAESLVLVTDTIISVEEHLTGWLFHELCSECAKDDSNVRLDRGRIA